MPVSLKKILTAAVSVISLLSARPYAGDTLTLDQPDGSPVQVKVFGDEYYQRIESLDGFTLVRDEKGWICTAVRSADGSKLTAGERFTALRSARSGERHLDLNREAAEQIRAEVQGSLGQQRSRAPLEYPKPAGKIYGLTILIDFSDDRWTIPAADADSFMNGDRYTANGNVSSIRKWFADMSNGKVDYHNIVTNYYQAKQNKSYYDNPAVSVGPAAQELIREAMADLIRQGFDFEALTEVDGAVPLNVLYSGRSSSGWSKGLWPHQGFINSEFGGKYFGRYQITEMSEALEIGTVVHENGHMLCGYPDLYPYGDVLPYIQTYCTMGTGGVYNKKNPMPYNPLFRELSGWIAPTNLTGKTDVSLSLTPSANGDVCKVVGPGERFYIDARLKTGKSSQLPGSGLLIWHVFEDGSNTNPAEHPLINIVHADGNITVGEPGDLFQTKSGDLFTPLTSPSSNWYTGTSSGLILRNLNFTSSVCTFDLGNGGETVKKFSITSPSGGSFSVGDTVKISWDSDLTGTVSVSFLKEGKSPLTLGTAECSKGEFLWVIGSSVPTGSNGAIELKLGTQTVRSEPLTILPAMVRYPQKSLKAIRCDSKESAERAPEFALDGNPATFWETEWSSANPVCPHEMVIELTGEKVKHLVGFGYQGRGDGGINGTVKDFAIELSDDGEKFTEIAKGSLSPSGTKECMTIFDVPAAPKRYLKFRALSEINGNPWTTMGEFNLYYDSKADSVSISLPLHAAGSVQFASLNGRPAVTLSTAQTGELKLFALNGRMIFRSGVRQFESGTVQMDVFPAAGTYAVRFETASGSVTQKICIQK